LFAVYAQNNALSTKLTCRASRELLCGGIIFISIAVKQGCASMKAFDTAA
jgi:hypothetical protein